MSAASTNPEWVAKVQNQSRLSFGLAVTDMAARDDRVVAISADTLDLIGLREMVAAAPERVIEAGIAEQNAMGMASGLATTGMRPYLCGYAPFITARSMEQLRNDVAYANQRVVIGAACSGIVLGVSGGTHHALEDIALMRSLPNMTVMVPADALEAWHLTQATETLDGPSYVRIGGKFDEPAVTAVDASPTIGKATTLRRGTDVTVIACGCMVVEALAAADELASEGIGVRVLNMHTIKPLDEQAILSYVAKTGCVVTAEEHMIKGGLGDSVAQVLARNTPAPQEYVGVNDTFGESGKPEELLIKYGIDTPNVIEAAKKAILRK